MPPVLGAKPLAVVPGPAPQVISTMQQSPNIHSSSSINVQPMSNSGSNFNSMQSSDIDLRAMSGVNIGSQPPIDPRMGRGNIDQDLRPMPNPVPPPLMDPRNQRQMQQQPINAPVAAFPIDPRQRPIDPRLRNAGPSATPGPIPSVQQSAQQQLQNRLATNCGLPNDASDQEKAALIMQVLQLTDEQISQLPPEQRTSILVLKEQIAKSTQR